MRRKRIPTAAASKSNRRPRKRLKKEANRTTRDNARKAERRYSTHRRKSPEAKVGATDIEMDCKGVNNVDENDDDDNRDGDDDDDDDDG